MVGTKQTHCKRGHELVLENTYVTSEGKRRCKPCQRERSREYQKRRRSADPEGDKARKRLWRKQNPGREREYDLKRHYGLSVEDFDLLLEEQNFCCAICSNRLDSSSACVDHDHETDEVRGLLCRSCNIGLGHLQDDYEIILAAADYLIQSKDKVACEVQRTKAKSNTV